MTAPVPPHPIEVESYRILGQRTDLSRFGPLAREVVARVIHASADLDYAATMALDEASVDAGLTALRAGAPVVVDVEMVRSGINRVRTVCYLGHPSEQGGRADQDLTRSANGIRTAAARHPEGAVLVVGCAPTALTEAVRMHAEGRFRPALVIGLPVGFVGAVEAKEALRRSGLPSISNVGEKGGSAVAAAAFNALARLAGRGLDRG